VANFDLDQYIASTWYVQKQQVNGYQKPEDLFCVTATYNKKDGGGELVEVSNRANEGAINKGLQGKGKGIFSSFSSLCAKQLEDNTGKLEVQPCFLFNTFNPFDTAGPYWVIAVGEQYDWAIISGGQPSEVISDGKDEKDGSVKCTTKESGTNGSGLWLFTREPVASDAKIQLMESKLEAMGVSTSKLLSVAQKGCTYEGMQLKSAKTAKIAEPDTDTEATEDTKATNDTKATKDTEATKDTSSTKTSKTANESNSAS